jgi:hypothetical protein
MHDEDTDLVQVTICPICKGKRVLPKLDWDKAAIPRGEKTCTICNGTGLLSLDQAVRLLEGYIRREEIAIRSQRAETTQETYVVLKIDQDFNYINTVECVYSCATLTDAVEFLEDNGVTLVTHLDYDHHLWCPSYNISKESPFLGYTMRISPVGNKELGNV